MSEIYIAHHGVKGMKWGVRRYQNKDGSLTPAGKKRYAAELDEKRAAYKQAKASKNVASVNKRIAKGQYDDAFNRAYNYSQNHTIGQYFGKGKIESDRLWEEAKAKGEDAKAASTAYKLSKREYKQAKRNYRDAKTNAKYEKYGLDPTNTDHIVNVYNFGYKGAQRIQKRMETKHISDFKSSMIEGGRTAATTALLTVGTVATIGAIAKFSNPTAQVLDAGGKVLKNIYN